MGKKIPKMFTTDLASKTKASFTENQMTLIVLSCSLFSFENNPIVFPTPKFDFAVRTTLNNEE